MLPALLPPIGGPAREKPPDADRASLIVTGLDAAGAPAGLENDVVLGSASVSDAVLGGGTC